jgi:GT2 family glycosyltransferase
VTVSLVVVSYRQSSVLPHLLAALDDVDEIVVVDHSEDDREARALGALAIDRLVTQENRGYAAGLNRGVREAAGELLVLANPDVVPAPGSIRALTAIAAREDVGVAAAALTWDENGDWHIPQAQHLTWWRELEARHLPRRAWRRYIREQTRVWSATAPVSTPVVSGTLMAVRRDVLAAAGRLDERYFLFFEENDLCMRVARLGLDAVVVPQAVAFHRVGVSVDPRADLHMARSLERYRRLWFPAWYTTLVPDPIEPAPNPLRTMHGPVVPTVGARWVIGAPPRFIPTILGPPVAEIDRNTDGFWPEGIPRHWQLGVLSTEALTVRLVQGGP